MPSDPKKAPTAGEANLLVTVLKHNQSALAVNWEAVASDLGNKNGSIASQRFGQIRKKLKLGDGKGTSGGMLGNGITKRATTGTARAPRATKATTAARKPAAKKSGTNVKPRGPKAKARFVESVKQEESDDEEEAEQEEPRDLMAGSDDEEQGESDETAFEEKVNRGDYADSDSGNLSDGAVADLQRQIDENDLQKQIAEEVEEEYDAYDPDAVFEDAVEEVAGAHGHAGKPVPTAN